MESCLDDKYKLERLDESHDFSSFFCGVKELDNCLHSDFFQQVKSHKATALGALLNDELVAVFAIGEHYIELDREDIELVNLKLDNQLLIKEDSNSVRIPSMEIYFLAVKKEKRRNKIGTKVIDTIIELVESQKPDLQFLSLDALKEAIGFYVKVGFDKAEMDMSGNPTVRMYKALNLNEELEDDGD